MDMELLMPVSGYLAASVTLFFIGFVGFFSNLIVIVMMFREKQLWTPLNVILFNLVASDFSVSVLGNPFTLASAINMSWAFGQDLCIAYGFFMSLLGISSIGTLSVLALERYLIISQPVSRSQLTKKSALLVVIVVWIYSTALTAPPLFGWGEYTIEAANISCSVNWETRSYSTTSYIIFLFTFGFFLPVIIISFSYINIIVTVKKNMMSVGRVKAEARVAGMVAVMIVAFFLAWTPYAVLALLVAFLDIQLSPALTVVPALVAKTSICYNPIIYVGLNTQFRAAWKRLLRLPVDGETSVELATTAVSATASPRPAALVKMAHETVLLTADSQHNNKSTTKVTFIFADQPSNPSETNL